MTYRLDCGYNVASPEEDCAATPDSDAADEQPGSAQCASMPPDSQPSDQNFIRRTLQQHAPGVVRRVAEIVGGNISAANIIAQEAFQLAVVRMAPYESDFVRTWTDIALERAKKFWDDCLTVAKKIARPHDQNIADDIAQDVILKVLTKSETLGQFQKLNAWIRSIARNGLIDAIRKQRRQKTFTFSRDGLNVLSANNEEGHVSIEVSAALEDALLDLTEKERLLIHQRIILEMQVTEIAAKYDVTVGQASRLCGNALKVLKQRFQYHLRKFDHE